VLSKLPAAQLIGREFVVAISVDGLALQNAKHILFGVGQGMAYQDGDAVGPRRRWVPVQPFAIKRPCDLDEMVERAGDEAPERRDLR